MSLVTCPVALYPATSESEKISFNQLNRQTGHRIKYLKVDAETGDEVPNEEIVKGYQLDKDQFIEVTKEELEEVALESTRTIEIDEFVDKNRSPAIRHAVQIHFKAMLMQLQIGGACNALHPVQARMARWLLDLHDRVDRDVLPLTQEALSQILGVRRTTVTLLMRNLRASGAIKSERRGEIEIDPSRLAVVACECRDCDALKSLILHHAAEMAPFFPKPMQDAGTSMHHAASRLAIALQNASVAQSFDAMREVNAALHEVTSFALPAIPDTGCVELSAARLRHANLTGHLKLTACYTAAEPNVLAAGGEKQAPERSRARL